MAKLEKCCKLKTICLEKIRKSLFAYYFNLISWKLREKSASLLKSGESLHGDRAFKPNRIQILDLKLFCRTFHTLSPIWWPNFLKVNQEYFGLWRRENKRSKIIHQENICVTLLKSVRILELKELTDLLMNDFSISYRLG